MRNWLYKPSYVEPKPNEIVELADFPDSFAAEELKQLLENAGMWATIYPGDVQLTAVLGSVGTGSGSRVMVLGKDLEEARRVLSDFTESH